MSLFRDLSFPTGEVKSLYVNARYRRTFISEELDSEVSKMAPICQKSTTGDLHLNTSHGELTNRLKKALKSYCWTFSTSARTFAINSNVPPEFSLR